MIGRKLPRYLKEPYHFHRRARRTWQPISHHAEIPCASGTSRNRAPNLQISRARLLPRVFAFQPVAPPPSDKWTHTSELGGLTAQTRARPNLSPEATSPPLPRLLLCWKESAPAASRVCSVLGLRLRVAAPRPRLTACFAAPRPRVQSVAQCGHRDKSPGFTRLYIYPSIFYKYPRTGV